MFFFALVATTAAPSPPSMPPLMPGKAYHPSCVATIASMETECTDPHAGSSNMTYHAAYCYGTCRTLLEEASQMCPSTESQQLCQYGISGQNASSRLAYCDTCTGVLGFTPCARHPAESPTLPVRACIDTRVRHYPQVRGTRPARTAPAGPT
jgi:hypothetical protein